MSKKLISFLLTFALLISLCAGLVVTASAEQVVTSDGFVVDKTAELQNDGTIKITLEAYATGEEVTTTTDVAVASDIVLVLDVSGSMGDRLNNAVTTTQNLSVLDTTVASGYYVVRYSNDNHDMRYTGTDWEYKDGNQWKKISDMWFTHDIYVKSTYGVTKMKALQDAVCAFIDSVAADATKNNVEHSISIVKFADDSYYSGNHLLEGNHRNNSGYNKTELVKNFLSVNASTNVTSLKNAVNAIVAGGATSADYGMSLAQEVLNQSAYQNDGKVKTVVMFTDGEPNHDNGFDNKVANDTISSAKTMKDSGVTVFTVGVFNNPSTNTTNYMNYVSSNYPGAQSMTNAGTRAATKFYMTASSADQLQNVFVTIAQESVTGGSSSTADATTTTKDILADEFVLTVPEGMEAGSCVTVKTADVSPSSTSDGLVFLEPEASGLTAAVNAADGTIEVTGFDFADNWCGKRGDSTWQGKKLIIEISNVMPTTSAFTGEQINTNADGSGVYTQNASMPFAEFVSPKLPLAVNTVVVDYAKEMDITASAGLTTAVKLLESAPALKYGEASIDEGKVIYELKTTSVKGEDKVYVFGQNGSQNAWGEVTVVPATNIYYEDSFLGSATAVDADGNAVELPSITWSDNWTTTTDESAATNDNVASVTDGGNGWIDAIATEKGYTDGSATVAEINAASTATAEISFTGTGLDVYTKTTPGSGVVIAVLKAQDADSTVKTKLLKVYNQSKSGTYYSVPTLSFGDLPYGTYTLTIMVTSDATTRAEGLFDYCIDGIRVYNPSESNTAKFVDLADVIGAGATIFLDENSKVVAKGDTLSINGKEIPVTDLMAKNEVYLQGTATVTIDVPEAEEYYIGMKSLTGSEVTATFSNGKVNEAASAVINHTGDLYYKVEPTEGKITVKASGEGVLALTKLQMIGAADADVTVVTGEEAVTRAVAFASYQVVPYTAMTLQKAEDERVIAPEVEEPVVEITTPVITTVVKPVADAPVIDQAFILRVTNIINSFRALFARG